METISLQIQVNKQKQRQLQDQKLSNETMSYLLATLEDIYVTITEKSSDYKERFNFYKINNFQSKKLIEKYIQLNTQLYLLNTSVYLYKKEYSKYDFPDNFTEEDLKKSIEIIKSHPDLEIYLEFLENIFYKDQEVDHIDLGKKIKNNLNTLNQNLLTSSTQSENSSPNFELTTLFNQIPNIKTDIVEKEENIAKEYLIKGDNTKISINIDSESKDNPLVHKITYSENINGKSNEEIYERVKIVENEDEKKIEKEDSDKYL